MAEINFNVPVNKLPRIVAAMVGLYPVPQIPDPEFVGDPNDAPLINEFTDGQWAKEAVRRSVIRNVKRWEHKTATDAAAATITEDDELLS